MKTRVIITAIIAAASFSTLAAHELLTDGKAWNCVLRMYGDQTGEFDRLYTISVIGDTIVGDKKCKRMEEVYRDAPYVRHFVALERDGRVYSVTDDFESEFLNFNLSVGDTDCFHGRVIAVDEVMVGGVAYKRITIDRDGYLQYIVEGIGLSDDYLRDYEQCSYYTVLLSVTEKGRQVFTARDFTRGTTGIHSVNSPIDSRNEQTFDLSGRRACKSTHGIVVIEGNKKVLK